MKNSLLEYLVDDNTNTKFEKLNKFTLFVREIMEKSVWFVYPVKSDY